MSLCLWITKNNHRCFTGIYSDPNLNRWQPDVREQRVERVSNNGSHVEGTFTGEVILDDKARFGKVGKEPVACVLEDMTPEKRYERRKLVLENDL